MSGQRAAAEPYTTRFETEVTSIDGRRVWLERSYFYGESGGQPSDRGTIGDIEVTDVQLVDGEQVHVLAEEPAFRAGHRVLCSIDWSFRMYCMRAHTAGHVLYGAGRRLLEDPRYAGLEIGEERVRVDLETPTPIDDETLLELDTLVNRAVWESRPVSWETVPVAEARERDEIAFTDATEDGALEKGRVRVVTIEEENAGGSTTLTPGRGATGDPWDVAACGGTHVRNTREIGPVTVLGCSNPDSGGGSGSGSESGSDSNDELTRIELAVGPEAIAHREAEKRIAFETRRVLGTSLESVDDELSRLREERDELAASVESHR